MYPGADNGTKSGVVPWPCWPDTENKNTAGGPEGSKVKYLATKRTVRIAY